MKASRVATTVAACVLVGILSGAGNVPRELASGVYTGKMRTSDDKWTVRLDATMRAGTFAGSLRISPQRIWQIRDGHLDGDTLRCILSGNPDMPCTLVYVEGDSLYEGECCSSEGPCSIKLVLKSFVAVQQQRTEPERDEEPKKKDESAPE